MGRTTFLRRRRGNAAITALTLTAVLGFGALAVDVAWVRVNNAQLAAALDAATLAGAGYLDGTPEGVDLAVQKAVEFGNLNGVSVGFELDPGDVITGYYDEEERTFTAMGAADADQVNAVRIDAELSAFDSILAGVAFGDDTLSTRASSMALRPIGGIASEVPCFLPLAVPSCMFPAEPTANPAPFPVAMGNSNTDNIGWALPDGVSANAVRRQLEDGCESGAVQVGETMEVMNGGASSAVQTLGRILDGWRGLADTWDYENLGPMHPREEPYAFLEDSYVGPSQWGNVVQGPIALVDVGGEPGTCAGAENFNGTREIDGFSWGVIYDARSGNAMTQGFMIQLDFVTERAS